MVTGVNSSIIATNSLGSNRGLRRANDTQMQGSEESKEVAFDKINDIKERIAKGTYAIDIDKTSRKMASDLLNL